MDIPPPPEPEYDAREDSHEWFEDWLAGAGFVPRDPEVPDTRRADYLKEYGYKS